jgi:predicted AlkP superfamily phosphohydrolase/phosphomutase
MWSAAEQRVRSHYDFPAPEPVWDRLGVAGRRALVIDPYEGRRPRALEGQGIGGWQFRHKITLHPWSIPRGLDRQLRRQLGPPPLVEEIYGRPARRNLLTMRERLLESPRRAAEAAVALLSRERFDLVWITLSAPHIAGHWFLNPSRLPPDTLDPQAADAFAATLGDAYAAVDSAMSRILDALPAGVDLVVLSPSGMGPNASRCHLLPGMLHAVLGGHDPGKPGADRAPGGSLWRLRAGIPTPLRAWVARVLPDRLTLELTARLEMRGVDWASTRAFAVPSGDCGYIRLNLMGRERDGIVDLAEAPRLLDQVASGLRTFRDPDGEPAVRTVEFVSSSLQTDLRSHSLPDLVVHWNERVPPHLAGVTSARFGDVQPPGWGSGRTGEHCDGAWALVVPGSAKPATLLRPPHIIDIAPTVCAVLGVDLAGLPGQALLERRTAPHA